MCVRVFRYSLPLALLLFAVLPQSLLARGISIRGQEISSSGAATGVVSKCSCTDEWFTMGLRPGTATIVATVKSHSGVAAPSYGIRVVLVHGSRSVGFSQAACLAAQHHCNATARITIRVTKRDAYFLKVSGLGANGIRYTVHVQAAVYRVR